jgi:hypothetical protein
MAKGSTPDFAAIRIFDEERDDKWRVVFYTALMGTLCKSKKGYKLAPGPETLPLGRKLE